MTAFHSAVSIDESGYKHIWRCKWHGLDLELFLFCVYKELHAYGQMNVCHAHKAATSACTLMCNDGIRVRGGGVNQMTKHVSANWFNHTLVSSMIIVNSFHSIASTVASLDCSATGHPIGQLLDWLSSTQLIEAGHGRLANWQY